MLRTSQYGEEAAKEEAHSQYTPSMYHLLCVNKGSKWDEWKVMYILSEEVGMETSKSTHHYR